MMISLISIKTVAVLSQEYQCIISFLNNVHSAKVLKDCLTILGGKAKFDVLS